MEDQKTPEALLPDAEDMARQLARAPADKRALLTALGDAMSAAMAIGAAIAAQSRKDGEDSA